MDFRILRSIHRSPRAECSLGTCILKTKTMDGGGGLEFLDPRPASKYLKRMASLLPFCGAHAHTRSLTISRKYQDHFHSKDECSRVPKGGSGGQLQRYLLSLPNNELVFFQSFPINWDYTIIYYNHQKCVVFLQTFLKLLG